MHYRRFGYRDLSVVFNTEYKDTEEIILVTIRQVGIISATKFSMKVYEELNMTSGKTTVTVSKSDITSVYICQQSS